jgi:hypothetical protein
MVEFGVYCNNFKPRTANREPTSSPFPPFLRQLMGFAHRVKFQTSNPKLYGGKALDCFFCATFFGKIFATVNQVGEDCK